jgi:SPP1 gp7 family putative phage head morphogenesis protein
MMPAYAVALPVSRRVTLAYDLNPRQKRARADFSANRRIEKDFARKLRMIADHIAKIVRDLNRNTLSSAFQIGQWAARYAETLLPWAQAVVAQMHQQLDSYDRRQWRIHAAEMGKGIEKLLDDSPTGDALKRMMGEQVTLITSIPTDAARRVHELTMQGLVDGTRSREIEAEIMRTGDVTRSRARLIARTETARTASVLTQVRAQSIGCDGYIWRTSKDAQVRPSHKKLEGRYVEWNDPPECDPPHRAHAGQIWNCRCWMEPVLKFD